MRGLLDGRTSGWEDFWMGEVVVGSACKTCRSRTVSCPERSCSLVSMRRISDLFLDSRLSLPHSILTCTYVHRIHAYMSI